MRSRWSVLVAFAVMAATTQLLWLTFAPITTEAGDHYGVGKGAIGWLANVFPLVYVVLAIPAGMVLDRWFRGGLIAGGAVTLLGAVVRLGGDQFGWALVGQVLIAVGQPLVLNAITGVAGHYLAEDDRPQGIAVASASTFAGMIAAFALGSALPAHITALLIVNAVIAAAAIAFLAVALRTPPLYHRRAPASGVTAFLDSWRDPVIRRLCLVVFVPFGVFVSLTTWAEALLKPAGVSSGEAGIILIANVVAGVAGCALVPLWASRHRRELTAMLVAIGVTAVGCGLLAVAPGLVVGLVTFSVIGLVLLPALPIVLELTERRSGESEGSAAGLIWLAGNLGGIVLAAVVGVVVNHPAPAFVLLGAATLLAVGPVLSLRRDVVALAHEPVAVSTAARSGELA